MPYVKRSRRAAARNNITPTKNTRRPSRSRSRRAPHRAKEWQIAPDDADLQALSQEEVESELNRLIKCQRLVIDLLYTYYLSLWLYHFYGHEGYRKDLRDSAKGLLHLAPRVEDAKQKRHIERLLRRVLTHQLDWSLDDLDLDSTERQIVDKVLADLPAPDFEIK